jgi:hypothetical protein
MTLKVKRMLHFVSKIMQHDFCKHKPEKNKILINYL